MTTPQDATEALARALTPARRGGVRVLPFDNGLSERYQSVFVQHGTGEWDRILIARDDGTIAQLIVDLINGAALAADGWSVVRTEDALRATVPTGLDVERLCHAVAAAGYDPLGMLTEEEWQTIAAEYARLGEAHDD